MQLKKSISPILFFLCCLTLSAQQQYRFISYNVSNGLSQNSVHCIFQDSDGLLWLGTQDGLNSFDGRNFKTYKYSSTDTTTISDQFVLSITEDNLGYLWIGTGNGLNRLNRRTGKFTRYYLAPEEKKRISSNYPVLTRNKEGEIFVRHYKSPILINQRGDMINLDTVFKKLSFPAFDSRGTLWSFGFADKKFYSARLNESATIINEITNVPAEITKSSAGYRCTTDENNTIWCWPADAKGKIYFYNTVNNEWHSLSVDIPSAINNVMIIRNGTAWINTIDGVYIVSDYLLAGKISRPDGSSNVLPAGSILCSYEDINRNIWVGCANSGFAYYNPAFDNYNLFQTGYTSDAVTTAIDINSLQRWIGTSNGLFQLVRKKDTDEFKIFRHLFAGKRISGLTKDKQDRLWAAIQQDGLYILNKEGNTIKKHTQQDSLLQSKNILSLYCDSRNRVFVCSEKGYFVFTSPGKWTPFYQYNKKPVGSGWYTLYAFEDSKKNIWLCKHIGLEKLDENFNVIASISSAETNSPISRTLITACTEDSEGNLWIATLSSGIYSYDGKNLNQFTTSDGLNSNAIYGIITDAQNRIWATTTSGINVFVPEEKRFYPLTVQDGLPSNDFLLGAFFKNENGELLAGSSKGLITIDANKISFERKKAKARLSDLKINGESVVSLSSPFEIKPGYKTVSFEFSVKEALQPRNIFYQYRLSGVDDKWITVPADNAKITFSKLPYKKLTMEVRAAYSLADMDIAPVEKFTINVIPPFWQSTGFRILAALIIAGLIAFIVQQYNKIRYRKKLQALELQKELQQERSRISRDLHDNIGAYTSALIAGINQLKNKNGNKEENITELNEYASNIMGYLRETIWVLNNQHLTLTAFTDRFKNYASRIIKNYPELSLLFHEQIVSERELSPQISLNLFRIMQEALQNACKHADATALEINFSSNHKIELSVTDSGKGIGTEKRDDSYGMANMQERAGEIGFSFIIKSENGSGTKLMLAEK